MIQPGLERISRLLSRTPLRWRAIHVAGTNGKGSICAYLSRMLTAYNDSEWRRRRVDQVDDSSNDRSASHNIKSISHGRFTSPHLIDRWDCITINDQPVSSHIFHAVEKRVVDRDKSEGIGASEFELLTATAFEIFNGEKIDVGVVEVGMGGLTDATNIIGTAEGVTLPQDTPIDMFRPPPLVTVISRIGLDHQDFLGNTLEAIARQKAGIIKPGVPVICYDGRLVDNGSTHQSYYKVHQTIGSIASEQGAPVIQTFSTTHRERRCPSFQAEYLSHLDTIVDRNKLPSHQRENAVLAFTAAWSTLQQLNRIPGGLENTTEGKSNSSYGVPDGLSEDLLSLAKHMLAVVSTTVIPGRQQLISIENLTARKQPVLLDGAHNADSFEALAVKVAEIRKHVPTQHVTWVLALSNSKDPEEVLAGLIHEGDSIFTVEFGPVEGMPWVKALSSIQLLESMHRKVTSTPEGMACGGHILQALQMATDEAQGGPLVIAGSLYLVQDVLRLLRKYAHRHD